MTDAKFPYCSDMIMPTSTRLPEQFSETVRQIPPHRIMAINRGEKENCLKAKLDWDKEAIRRAAVDKMPLSDHPHAEFLGDEREDLGHHARRIRTGGFEEAAGAG